MVDFLRRKVINDTGFSTQTSDSKNVDLDVLTQEWRQASDRIKEIGV
jgi:hypothetical protein